MRGLAWAPGSSLSIAILAGATPRTPRQCDAVARIPQRRDPMVGMSKAFSFRALLSRAQKGKTMPSPSPATCSAPVPVPDRLAHLGYIPKLGRSSRLRWRVLPFRNHSRLVCCWCCLRAGFAVFVPPHHQNLP